ncbi:hypothetical protein AC578_2870 [Pseudocercospora eumusae]|uniref:MYND-type domain-containing protein n=1 Tax=Pseudocercospora eumusae TaxID=321146 RepID=A0A139H3N1_9PEZI|nr:hypothetical protein AC578_2870 [Pseudocercospora eumusae]
MPLLPRYANLDPTAPLPEGQAWAIMIRPITSTEPEDGGVELYKLPVSLSHHAWTTSEISRKVGFPLQLSQWQHRETSLPNPAIARALFFSTTQDENFGTCSEAWTGDVVAIRGDGKEVVEEHLFAYLSHAIYPLLEALSPLRSLLAHETDTNAETRKALQKRLEGLKEKALRKVSAPVFHAYFEQYRDYYASQMRQNEEDGVEVTDSAWLGLPSPVQVTLGPDRHIPVPCSVCDGTEGKMMRCGPCKANGEDVWYCGKECQREDWKGGHKDVCG